MEEKDRAGQDVVADHQDLALDASLAGGPLGGQDVDAEAAADEADRFRIQREQAPVPAELRPVGCAPWIGTGYGAVSYLTTESAHGSASSRSAVFSVSSMVRAQRSLVAVQSTR